MAASVERVHHTDTPFGVRGALAFLLIYLAFASAEIRASRHGAFANDLQAGGSASRNPACTVLTVAEIRSLTGFPGYRSPSPPPDDSAGQGAGGSASCQFESTGPTVDARGNPVILKGPLLSIVLTEGKDYTRTAKAAAGCKRDPVAGVGDLAYFEICPNEIRSRTPPLYVKAGNKDLIVQMDIDKAETDASTRPKVVAVAKAAAAKLR
jgi:hypothetical protein